MSVKGFPVILSDFGIPVVNTPLGPPCTVVENGLGTPIRIVENGFGTPMNVQGVAPPPGPTPESIFEVPGTTGMWFLPGTEYGECFQERTGASATTPAGNGNPLGTYHCLITDQYLTSLTSDDQRPILRSDGSKWWIEPDGVDDSLTSGATFTLKSDWYIGLTCYNLEGAGTDYITMSAVGSGANFISVARRRSNQRAASTFRGGNLSPAVTYGSVVANDGSAPANAVMVHETISQPNRLDRFVNGALVASREDTEFTTQTLANQRIGFAGGATAINTTIAPQLTRAYAGLWLSRTPSPAELSMIRATLAERGQEHPFLPETEALTARFTTPPTYARKTLINNTIGALIDAGVWGKLDCLYIMAAADTQAARQNWIQNAYNGTLTNSPVFTTDRGYDTNGTTSYINTNFNPSTAGGNYVNDDASFGFWSRTPETKTGWDMGAWDGVSASIIACRHTLDESQLYLNNIASTTSRVMSMTDGSGLFGVSRTASTGFKSYKNGDLNGDFTVDSNGVPSLSFFVGGYQRTGLFNPNARQYAMAFIGGGLTDGEMEDFYDIIDAYMQAVGAA
jgi:hypothetical protein